MVVVRGKVVGVGEHFEFKVGNQTKADYCAFTLNTQGGELVEVVASTKTMMNKTFMKDANNHRLIQVGMVKPKVGDTLEVEGSSFSNDDGFHQRTIKYVTRILRETRQKLA